MTVVFDISVSLDGYVTADRQTPDEPMGPGGLRLVEWALGADEAGAAYLAQAVTGNGAVICGRTTYDHSLPWWGTNGPTGEARVPVFVVTHHAPTDGIPDDGVYTFVTTGIEDALQQAQQTAGDKVVCVMGGASMCEQYLRAGLLDELSLHIVPVLFGAGTPLWEGLGPQHRQFELVDSVQTPTALHARFRVVKDSDTS